MKFKLYASCLPVRGFKRSLIYDSQRSSYKFIPNILFDILTESPDLEIERIKNLYGHNNSEYIDSYFEFLLDSDLGFWCSDNTVFPELELKWESPSLITNAIIDVNMHSKHNYVKIANELDGVGCQALQIRFYNPIATEALCSVLTSFSLGRLNSIDILFAYSAQNDAEQLQTICLMFPRVNSIIVHSAPYKKVVDNSSGNWIAFTDEHILNHTFCGVVDPSYFCNNLDVYTESLNFNNCLNKKISIDVNGYIKNCPSAQISYGDSFEMSLEQVANMVDFQAVWSISKDKVEVCKDCEFRYMCLDCRVHIKDLSNGLSKPAKCHYDPYSAKWNDQ